MSSQKKPARTYKNLPKDPALRIAALRVARLNVAFSAADDLTRRQRAWMLEQIRIEKRLAELDEQYWEANAAIHEKIRAAEEALECRVTPGSLQFAACSEVAKSKVLRKALVCILNGRAVPPSLSLRETVACRLVAHQQRLRDAVSLMGKLNGFSEELERLEVRFGPRLRAAELKAESRRDALGPMPGHIKPIYDAKISEIDAELGRQWHSIPEDKRRELDAALDQFKSELRRIFGHAIEPD